MSNGFQRIGHRNGNPALVIRSAQAGAWLANYGKWPLTILVSAVGLAAPLLVAALSSIRNRLVVFIVSGCGRVIARQPRRTFRDVIVCALIDAELSVSRIRPARKTPSRVFP
ncbi:MAG: hypothetical protein ACYDAH_18540 [Steroidobacteraceae bacterium]